MYARRATEEWQALDGQRCRIPEVTSNEVGKELLMMKKGKAADANGVVAEMIQMGGQKLHSAIANLFNDVLVNNAEAPEERKIPESK